MIWPFNKKKKWRLLRRNKLDRFLREVKFWVEGDDVFLSDFWDSKVTFNGYTNDGLVKINDVLEGTRYIAFSLIRYNRSLYLRRQDKKYNEAMERNLTDDKTFQKILRQVEQER